MLFTDSYQTIKEKTEGIYKDKGSKFIAIAVPVTTEDEVKHQLESIRNMYHDARHHCFAYMLGADKSAYRFNDDGEPSGTAGRPILGQINSFDLTNILVVVVRYFGGVKLGVRGLINAYKFATRDAFQKATVIKKTVNEEYEIHFKYPEMSKVMRIMNDGNVNIIRQDFSMHCLIKFSVRKKEAVAVYDRLSKIKDLKINYLQTV